MTPVAPPHGRISEVFASIQGEGVTAGLPSVFVRLQGCSVGCVWCDTKYSWDPAKGEARNLQALVEEVAASKLNNVVVTGGEPLESPLFAPLVSSLKARGHRIEVETSGVIEPPDLPVDQWNVSLKLAHSGVPGERRIQPNAIKAFLDLESWFKFVVAEPGDLAEILDLQQRFALPTERILLMPEGITREELLSRSSWIWEACRSHRFRYSPRLQIMVWGAQRGT
jgi:organic radical activating enzyme